MTAHAKEILLTGFPATQLARSVLAVLLARDPAARVTCLVPSRFLARAKSWLRERVPEAQARVTLLEGDVAHMDFGLSGKRWLELAAQTRLIHHCAAVTYRAAPRGMPERVNVGGAAEVIELAQEAKGLERVVHWSSTSATGPDEGVVLEEELIEPASGVIETSRFRAEAMMRKAQKHMPLTILRPAQLVGDSRTGEIDRLDGAYLLITTLLSSPKEVTLPLPGRADAPLSMLPVDYAALAGVQLSALSESEGRTLHIIDPRPVTLEQAATTFASLVGRPAPRRETISRLARALLMLPGVERMVPSHGAFVTELARHVRYDTRGTSGLLEPLGLACPTFDRYAELMVEATKSKRPLKAASAAGEERAPRPISQPTSSR